MIVSVAIFSVVMLLATGAYYSLIAAARQSREQTTAMTTLSFALEDMTRSIRTGSHFCITGCTGSSFSFKDAAGNVVVYGLSGTSITRQVSVSGEYEASGPITDPSVTITNLAFNTTGQSGGDLLQPRVTIVIRGTIPVGPGLPVQSFSVETGATQRVIDLSN